MFKIMLKNDLEGTKTLEEKSNNLRDVLNQCTKFVIFFYNFNLETIQLFKIMNQEFTEKIENTLIFNFGDEFSHDDFKVLHQVTQDEEIYQSSFQNKEINITVSEDQKLKRILPCF